MTLHARLVGDVDPPGPDGTVAVTVEVANTTDRALIVSVGVAPPATMASRPQRVIVRPGEVRQVALTVGLGTEPSAVVVLTAPGGVLTKLEVTPEPNLEAIAPAERGLLPRETGPAPTTGVTGRQKRWFAFGVVLFLAFLTVVAAIGPPDDDEPAASSTTAPEGTSTPPPDDDVGDGALVGGFVYAVDQQRVAGAAIEVLVDGQVVATATSEEDGHYEVIGFDSPGRVRLRVSAEGFSPLEIDVFVDPGGRVEGFDISLFPA